MTIFGWDASHYDGDLTDAVLVRAKNEGIEFFTHKLGEGQSNTDTTAGPALAAAKNAGIKVIGGYYFIHSGDMIAQAVRCIALADKMAPWWREFNGWFWQTDAEADASGHLPSPAEVKEFSDELALRSKRTVVVYASHGQYGNRLTGIGHSLWNANYPTTHQAGFRELYPGDRYAGWNDYSGQTPAVCQYTSSATIAGKTTCDANAFRGTIDQLLTLIGATVTTAHVYTPEEKTAREVWSGLQETNEDKGYTGKVGISAATDLGDGADAARAALVQSQANGASLTEIKLTLGAQSEQLTQILTMLRTASPPVSG